MVLEEGLESLLRKPEDEEPLGKLERITKLSAF